MTKIEYEIIKKEFNSKCDFLYLEFYYWVDGERNTESISIPSIMMDKWEKEIEYFLKKFETLPEQETKATSLVDNIVLNVKKEFKKEVIEK